MKLAGNMRARAFSLIELVIVVVIIAVISAIAIPRLSQGSAAASTAALNANWVSLQKAIDQYTIEHGVTPTLSRITGQLTNYSSEDGQSGATTPDSAHPYGPYLRNVPAVNSGPRAGQNGIGASDGPTIGWIYVANSGQIRPNIPTATPLAGEMQAQVDDP